MDLVLENFEKWKSRWISSVLEIFILFSISQKERFGGELVELSKLHVDEKVKVPTVYAIIKRYTNSGILEEYKVDGKSEVTRGRSRIYYRLNDDGAELIEHIKDHIDSKFFLQTLDFTFLEEGTK
jgi:DNA-binding PadR family transcriptional regulator